MSLAEDTSKATSVTELRKVERKAKSALNALDVQLGRIIHDSLSETDIDVAERLQKEAQLLLSRIQRSIEMKKLPRTPT